MIKTHVRVRKSKLKRETYLSNPRLSLCSRMKIKVMNESPSLLKCVLFVLPLIWPHILSDLIFRRSKNSTFVEKCNLREHEVISMVTRRARTMTRLGIHSSSLSSFSCKGSSEDSTNMCLFSFWTFQLKHASQSLKIISSRLGTVSKYLMDNKTFQMVRYL